MVLYQFLHQVVYLAIGRRNHFALFGLENNILYGLDLCRRARKSTLHHIGITSSSPDPPRWTITVSSLIGRIGSWFQLQV